jgi:hypothetical protein
MSENERRRKLNEARAKAAATRKAKINAMSEAEKEQKRHEARVKAAAARRAKRNALQGQPPAPAQAWIADLPNEGEERRKAMLKRFQLNTATRRRLQKKNPYVKAMNDWAI